MRHKASCGSLKDHCEPAASPGLRLRESSTAVPFTVNTSRLRSGAVSPKALPLLLRSSLRFAAQGAARNRQDLAGELTKSLGSQTGLRNKGATSAAKLSCRQLQHRLHHRVRPHQKSSSSLNSQQETPPTALFEPARCPLGPAHASSKVSLTRSCSWTGAAKKKTRHVSHQASTYALNRIQDKPR